MCINFQIRYIPKRNTCIKLIPTCTFFYSLVSCVITVLIFNQLSSCSDFDRGSTIFKQIISVICFSYPFIFFPYFIYFFKCIPLKPIIAFLIDVICFCGWIISIVSIITIILILFIVPTDLNQISNSERMKKEIENNCCYAYDIQKEFAFDGDRYGAEYEISCNCPILNKHYFDDIDITQNTNEKCQFKMDKELICCDGNILSEDLFWTHLVVLIPVSVCSGFISLYGLYTLNKKYHYTTNFKNLIDCEKIIDKEQMRKYSRKSQYKNENEIKMNLINEDDFDNYVEIELL